MGKYDIDDDYGFRITQIARLISLCGEDETRATEITVDELTGLLAGHYYPNASPTSPMNTNAEKVLYRVFYRTKEQARTNCYYRDILKARMFGDV